MGNEEIRKQIEQEKQQLPFFLKTAERLRLPKEEVEKQVNFYLEQISELLKKIN